MNKREVLWRRVMKKVIAKAITYFSLSIIYLILITKFILINYKTTCFFLAIFGHVQMIVLIDKFVEWLFKDKTNNLPTNCAD